jgi:CubicO group peptidase (beta-lactamase class C family)
MTDRIDRRVFLIESGSLALSALALSLDGGALHLGPMTDLERQLPLLMKEHHVPGVSLAVISAGKLGEGRAFGAKDAASKAPVDPATMFEAASMSKPAFAYAVLKLCERGVLDLDTPLTHYTSSRFLDGDPRLDLITARHVLSHTTGFPNWRSQSQPLSIAFTPGTRWAYSGEGYSYLQSVITELTKQPIEEFMRTNIFQPFGMTSSGYEWNDAFARKMARPHDEGGTPMDNKRSTPGDVARYASAGALLTTPTDYAKFMLEILDPTGPDEFRLRRSTIAEMVRPQVETQNEYHTAWGLGVAIYRTKNGEIVGHGGDNDGFHCISLMSLPHKAGIVVMTNSDGGSRLLNKLETGDSLTPFLR